MASITHFRAQGLALAFVVSTALLAACNQNSSSSDHQSENTIPDSQSENKPQANTSLSKTYIETYSYEGRRSQTEGNVDTATVIKADNAHAMNVIFNHEDNFLFSPYEEAQALAMLAVGTGNGPAQSLESNLPQSIVLLDENGNVVLDDNGNPVLRVSDPTNITILLDKNGNIVYDNNGVPILVDTTTVTPSSDPTETYSPGEGDQPLHQAMNGWDQQLQQLIDPTLWQRNSSLWGHENYLFLSSYLDTMAQYYGPQMSALSFMTDVTGSTKTISDWLGAASDNRLTPLMTYDGDQIGERTRVVTLNTETLKAAWTGLFDASQTSDERFKMLDGTMKLVPTMHANGTFDVTENDQYRAFQLPFDNSTLTLLVIMPKEGEFQNVQQQLDSSSLLNDVIASLKATDTTLNLPRFSIETIGEIVPPTDSSEDYSNFYDVNGQGYLLLKQKQGMATIDVTESGIDAHAGGMSVLDATANEPITVWDPSYTPPSTSISSFASATMSGDSINAPCYYPPQSLPFIFVIRETTTSTTLYAGTWTTPDGPAMEPDGVTDTSVPGGCSTSTTWDSTDWGAPTTTAPSDPFPSIP